LDLASNKAECCRRSRLLLRNRDWLDPLLATRFSDRTQSPTIALTDAHRHRDPVDSVSVSTRAKVFICYARRDETLCEELRAHLSNVQWSHKPTYEVWYDGAIEPGIDWPDRVHNELHQADIFIILLSKWLLQSSYVRDTELPVIERRRNGHECAVIVVQTTPLELTHTPFARIQTVLPKPLSAYARRDDAWPLVIRAVENAALAAQRLISAAAPQRRAPERGDKLAAIIPIRPPQRTRTGTKSPADGQHTIDQLLTTLDMLQLSTDPGWASFDLRSKSTRHYLREVLRFELLSPWLHEQALMLQAALQRLCDPSTDSSARSNALRNARKAVQELSREKRP
jgi:hypothetical protein